MMGMQNEDNLAMIRMDQQISMRPEMRQFLAPQMQQSLHMLQMNSFELDQFIEENLEINPFLERINGRETSLSEIAGPPANTAGELDEQAEQNYEQTVLGRSEWNMEPDYTERYREGGAAGRNTDLDEVWRYYQDSITQDESLSAHLLDQVRIAATSPQDNDIGERIIINDIDDRGYFTGNTAEIAVEMGVDEEVIRRVLDIIKKCEPTGVGAADVVECLLMQCEVEYPGEEELKQLLDNHWKALTQGRILQIAEAMGITPERVMELKGMLSRLDPFPGREYGAGPPPYITPEVMVEKINDDYIVTLTSEFMTSVMINDSYIKDIRSRKMRDDERAYVRDHLESARFLMRNIERRRDTILKTAQAIVDLQRDFMEKGAAFMKPLTLEEVAEKVGVHESTISRTVNGKYIQTPQGLFELKYFFSSGVRSDEGGAQSSTAVCALIKEIIEKEDRRNPLSDQKIADLLKEQGIHAARRTVTKYREQSGILPAKMRRTY